jgi:hypothetical protein
MRIIGLQPPLVTSRRRGSSRTVSHPVRRLAMSRDDLIRRARTSMWQCTEPRFRKAAPGDVMMCASMPMVPSGGATWTHFSVAYISSLVLADGL